MYVNNITRNHSGSAVMSGDETVQNYKVMDENMYTIIDSRCNMNGNINKYIFFNSFLSIFKIHCAEREPSTL